MFKTVLRRFARRKVSVLGAVILLFFLLVALFGPMFCTQDPLAQDLVHKYQQPSSEHWFGIIWAATPLPAWSTARGSPCPSASQA